MALRPNSSSPTALVYVQPSLMEGNSPALMTAMSYARGVVVSDIEQNVETIGDTGATFVSEDPSESRAEHWPRSSHDPQEVEKNGWTGARAHRDCLQLGCRG